MRVLVVEDDKKIASFVVNGLKQSGFAVETSDVAGNRIAWKMFPQNERIAMTDRTYLGKFQRGPGRLQTRQDVSQVVRDVDVELLRVAA